MTLDEAIAKAKADGDVQLAEWLRQARGADAAARWYTEKLRDANCTIRKLLNDNATLRQQLADVTESMGRVEERCAKLRELAKGLSWCSEERYLGHQESECPLYDERTDGKCRAEALMKELRIEVMQ